MNYVTNKQNYVMLSFSYSLTFKKWNYIHYCIASCNKFRFIVMNKTELKGNWNEQKGKLKKKFGFLIENDLMFEEGKQEEMFGKLQIKLGKTKEELQKIIDSD